MCVQQPLSCNPAQPNTAQRVILSQSDQETRRMKALSRFTEKTSPAKHHNDPKTASTYYLVYKDLTREQRSARRLKLNYIPIFLIISIFSIYLDTEREKCRRISSAAGYRMTSTYLNCY